jgi:hypothetical protein
MSPEEVQGLQGLAMAQGGSLTINPDTGLPEAFRLGGFFKSLLPTLVGVMTGGAGMPLYAGIAAGAATGALTNKNNRLLGAITGGLGGYSGVGIGSALKAAGTAVPKAVAATVPYKGGFVNPEVATGTGFGGAATTGADLAQNASILNNANQFGLTNSSLAGSSAGMPIEQALATSKPFGMANINNATASIPADPTYMGNLSTAGRGASEIFSGNQAAIDAYTKSIGAESAMGALGKTMLPVGGAAVFGGLEESDLYGKPVQRAEAEKYDPYARLNLNTDTGLRLVAKGGEIKSYALGGNVGNPSVGGGLSSLYNRPEGQAPQNISNDAYGLGRLSDLGSEQARYQAQTLGYAEGGDVAMNLDKLPTLNTVTGEQLSANGLTSKVPAYGMTELLGDVFSRNSAAFKEQYPKGIGMSELVRNTAKNAEAAGLNPRFITMPQVIDAIQARAVSQGGSAFGNYDTWKASKKQQGYAEGGVASLELQDPTVSPTSEPVANPETSVVNEIAKTQSNENEMRKLGLNALNSGNIPTNNYAPGSLASLAGAMKTQPVPPEAGFVQNLTSARTGYAKGGYLDGAGDGMSDSIPATIEGKQPARLADGEFVIPADVVSHLGNGSTKAGSKRLYAMLDRVRKARTGHTKQGKKIKPEKYMPA